jgi:hypothetical protein
MPFKLVETAPAQKKGNDGASVSYVRRGQTTDEEKKAKQKPFLLIAVSKLLLSGWTGLGEDWRYTLHIGTGSDRGRLRLIRTKKEDDGVILFVTAHGAGWLRFGYSTQLGDIDHPKEHVKAVLIDDGVNFEIDAPEWIKGLDAAK